MGLQEKPKSDATYGLSDFKRKIKKSPIKMKKTLETHSGTYCAFTIYFSITNRKFNTSMKAVTQMGSVTSAKPFNKDLLFTGHSTGSYQSKDTGAAHRFPANIGFLQMFEKAKMNGVNPS